eukprot:8727810-Pyramimonas_sp.AAC.1
MKTFFAPPEGRGVGGLRAKAGKSNRDGTTASSLGRRKDAFLGVYAASAVRLRIAGVVLISRKGAVPISKKSLGSIGAGN